MKCIVVDEPIEMLWFPVYFNFIDKTFDRLKFMTVIKIQEDCGLDENNCMS